MRECLWILAKPQNDKPDEVHRRKSTQRPRCFESQNDKRAFEILPCSRAPCETRPFATLKLDRRASRRCGVHEGLDLSRLRLRRFILGLGAWQLVSLSSSLIPLCKNRGSTCGCSPPFASWRALRSAISTKNIPRSKSTWRVNNNSWSSTTSSCCSI